MHTSTFFVAALLLFPLSACQSTSATVAHPGPALDSGIMAQMPPNASFVPGSCREGKIKLSVQEWRNGSVELPPLVLETEVEVGVPILSKIPLVDSWFTNTTRIKDERSISSARLPDGRPVTVTKITTGWRLHVPEQTPTPTLVEITVGHDSGKAELLPPGE